MAESVKFTMKIPGTKNIQVPDLQAEAKIDVSKVGKNEMAFLKHYEDYWKKNYVKELEVLLKKQIDGFATPLKSMEKTVVDYKSLHAEVQKVGYDGKAIQKLGADMEAKHKTLEVDYNAIVNNLNDMVKNINDQQILIHNQMFMKKAQKALVKKFKNEQFWKSVRNAASVTIKAALVITGVVIGGITLLGLGPVGAGILAFGAAKALFKVPKLYNLAKGLRDSFKLEKKAIKDVLDDLKEIEKHLGINTKNAAEGLAKHLSVASKYLSERRITVDRLDSEIDDAFKKVTFLAKTAGDIKSQSSKAGVTKVNSQATKDMVNLDKALKKFAKLSASRNIEVANLKKLENAFADASKLVDDLTKIPYQAPRSVMSRIHEVWATGSTIETIVETSGEVMDLVG